MGACKEFDKALFEDNDPLSREVVIKFLERTGVQPEENLDQYGIDILSANSPLCFEVERRPVWENGDFPFDEVNLPERKAKFFQDNNSIYIIICKDYTRIGIIYGHIIRGFISEANLKESGNKFVKNGEQFYKLPKSKFKFITL
jgi:hypothetical protein